jgi:hypothetical protein
LENESPLLRLLVWGLREEGYNAVSAPLPAETARFGEQAPRFVIINCQLPLSVCREVVSDTRKLIGGAFVLDMGAHDGERDGMCGADGHLSEPHRVDAVISWMKDRDRPEFGESPQS